MRRSYCNRVIQRVQNGSVVSYHADWISKFRKEFTLRIMLYRVRRVGLERNASQSKRELVFRLK